MPWYEMPDARWFIPILIWELVWKGLGIWRAGRDDQPIWFVAMFLLNTFGILPIVYLLFFSKSRRIGTSH